jgi:DDE superfamily endonuclease
MVVRTYAPVGKTPVLHELLSRGHLSAMSGITLEGRLYMLEQERAFKGEDVVRFLKHLMRQIGGKLLVIWDGSPIHRSGAVKDFLASGAASRVRLEQLPGYAPDLNPDEGIWKAPQVRGDEEPLLSESLGVEGGATQSEGALEAQKRGHPRLHQAAGL